jgi:hypothetical protein
MSRIYSKLREIEVEKQESVNRRSLLNILEKGAVPPEEESGVMQPGARMEGMDLSSETKGKSPSAVTDPHPLIPAFSKFADQLKTTLGSIKAFTELPQGRFKDPEFGDTFHRKVAGDIDTTYLELDCLLDYVRIKFPVRKTDSVRSLLEALFERNGKQLKEKHLKIARRQYEVDLPETGVQDEQLRYILNWVLQYVILSTAPGGSLAVLTRSCQLGQGAMDDLRTWNPEGGRVIEILIVFTHLERPNMQIGTGPGPQAASIENAKGFIFPLVEEILRENRGTIKFKAHQEKHVTQVSLMLPVERRKATYSG